MSSYNERNYRPLEFHLPDLLACACSVKAMSACICLLTRLLSALHATHACYCLVFHQMQALQMLEVIWSFYRAITLTGFILSHCEVVLLIRRVLWLHL